MTNSGDLNRCDYLENVLKYCDKEMVFYPENSYRVIRDEPFKPLDADGSAVQIKPQRVAIKLRPRILFKALFFSPQEKKVDLLNMF